MVASSGARCWRIPKSEAFPLLPPRSLAALLPLRYGENESTQILKNQLCSRKGFEKAQAVNADAVRIKTLVMHALTRAR